MHEEQVDRMCILVVEDDDLIRLILVEELEDAGFHVRQAATGDEAFAMLQTLDPPLTVLVTDVHMPGTRGGIELAADVNARYPDVPVIFTTGRPDSLRRRGRLGHNDVLVRKPYVPGDIIKVIQAAARR